jgi:predicted AAA+ superfamily ATPase
VSELVAYADLADDELVAALRGHAASPRDGALATALARVLYGLAEPLPGAIARRVLGSTGPFARAARRGLPAAEPRLRRAAAELDELGALAHADVEASLAAHGLGGCVPAATPPAPLPGPPLAGRPGWGEQAGALAAFHRAEGTGPLALARVLRATDAGVEAVADPDPIGIANLAGGEAQRAPLRADLAAFCERRRAPDALLYGPPGTGKSATVRACAAASAGAGLRLVQVGREQLEHLERVFSAVAGEGPPCLLFLDDLAFDDGSRADRALRAALEGAVEARPANVLCWATSNRLTLTHQTHSARADDVDAAAERGEKVALADRFGRRVRFAVPDEAAYLAIVRLLLRDRPEEVAGVEADALRFARTGSGPTPRTAHQFVATLRTAR